MDSYRKIFLIEPSHDFSAARKFTDNVVFVTTGEELVSELEGRIRKSLEDFDPLQDAIVPMGRVSSCVVTGMVLGSKFEEGTEIVMGIYSSGSYIFQKVSL